MRYAWVLTLLSTFLPLCAHGSDANRFTYLDEWLDPYYVNGTFAKLITPQWVGQSGVEAVVVLAIDDMREPSKYESFLRPILDRLKQIDGRAAVSIMTCQVDPADPQLEGWLGEGLSMEVHTIDHPCPCLAGGELAKAKSTYDRCVDLMAEIPGNRPVAFRMPCCDSRNTPSPRFWAEIFNRTSERGNYLSIDSSVFVVLSAGDQQLPRELVIGADGERFRRYLPFPSFVNTIENYPFPYIIGRLCWQFPCIVPSDWQAQHVQRPNNPRTVEDLKAALDAVVIKQGVMNLVFHPHGWIRNDQIVEFIDYATSQYGTKVKFLNFREAKESLDRHLLGGHPIRDGNGRDNGVRLVDLNGDHYLDVVIGNDQAQITRIWLPELGRWTSAPFPARIISRSQTGSAADLGVRFAWLGEHHPQTVLLASSDEQKGAWRLEHDRWVAEPRLLEGLELDGKPLRISHHGRDGGVRLRDVDRDGRVELIVANPNQNAVFQWDREGRWKPLSFALPSGVTVVDEQGGDAGLRFVDINQDGRDDLIYSNERRYGVYLFASIDRGWSETLREGSRAADPSAIPMIARGGANNGAWFHSGHLWVQNEGTDRLPDNVDRISFAELLRPQNGEAGWPPARSPAESLASFSARPGMKVELVASEPLISDPVAFDWGPDGRLWVAEMGDYPQGADGNGKPGGRVSVLADSDGDSRYDQASVFLDQLSYPTAVKAWRDGVLVLAAPELFYAEDRDGDGRADFRQALFRGFRQGNPQHLANGLRWGLDNWLYIANGDSGGTVRSIRSGKSAEISGRDVRVHIDQGSVDPLSGQTQYGRNRDDWGNWFGGNNSDPIWHYVVEDRYLRRNPGFVPPDVRKGIAAEPGAAPVYPTSRTLERFNDFEKANRFTSACSPMIYRDDLLGKQFYGNAFVCEPVHNLVHRQIVVPDGVSFRSERAADEQRSEFLTSTDNWFRPTMVRTGPDGALWIADMYRLVIEHPEWIPMKWQKRLSLREGAGLGRIYRVYAERNPPRRWARLDTLDTVGLVATLNSPNGWQRDMAQQMILWRGDRTARSQLEAMVTSAERPLARLHALSTLDGLGVLSAETLVAALADTHPAIVCHALRLSEPLLGKDRQIESAVLETLERAEPTIDLQLACTLGYWRDARASDALTKLALRHPDDRYVQTAVMSSLAEEHVLPVFQNVMAARTGDEANSQLIARVVEVAARLGNANTINEILNRLLVAESNDSFRARVAAVTAMLDVLERRGVPPARQVAAEARTALVRLKERARNLLRASDTSSDDRRIALALLSRPFLAQPMDGELMGELISAQQPPDVQVAAVEALGRLAEEKLPERLLADWAAHSPQLRVCILDVLLARTDWTERLLASVENGQVLPAQIDARRRQILLRYEDHHVRDWASRLFERSMDSDLTKLLDQYQDVLAIHGDAGRGKSVFTKRCASCHKFEDGGFPVGPDLSTLTNRSPEALLADILDPNRAVEDRFLDYAVILQDGRRLNGVIVRETSTSVVLAGEDGKESEILRAEIDQLRSSGKSLMPEGLQRDMSKQDLADVIYYVASRRPPPKQFAGNEPAVAPVRDDGSIRLLAIHSKIHGPTLVFEPKYRNLGQWQSAEDHAIWSLDVPAAGPYRVVIDYACDDQSAGNPFVIEAAGQVIGERVDGTGSWDNYRNKSVGQLTLPAGRVEVVMRSDGPIRSALIDLRAIRLHPMREN